MKFRDILPELLASNRAMMRSCALHYRHARAAGNVPLMVVWLILAREYKRNSREMQEAA